METGQEGRFGALRIGCYPCQAWIAAHGKLDRLMTTNPFSVPTIIPDQRGVFGSARRIRSGFLYRVIEIDAPLRCRVVYDGWWFRQKIEINGHTAWFQISWLTIRRRVDFRIPPQVEPSEPRATMEISFGPSLMIRRFRLWIADQIVYDEIN